MIINLNTEAKINILDPCHVACQHTPIEQSVDCNQMHHPLAPTLFVQFSRLAY